jgi:SAM-dependent MidA family methyltransferase
MKNKPIKPIMPLQAEATTAPLSGSTHRHAEEAALLHAHMKQEWKSQNGWLSFDRFMALALYTPGLGYYCREEKMLGDWPEQGSDFVTAPELSPYFGKALARQVKQGFAQGLTRHVFEFGAGSGALARELLETLGDQISNYFIIDLSGSLRQRQQKTLSPWLDKVTWLDAWPSTMSGIVIGNEVLDAMPVKLLHFDGLLWNERGLTLEQDQWCWLNRPTELKPPLDINWSAGATVEIHIQARAFIQSLAQRLTQGLALFIDYGFPEHEYYHPQRQQGTLMCHRLHRADVNPLEAVGDKDITSHINFTDIAMAAQEAGLEVVGYTSQAHFLINCGMIELLHDASLIERNRAQKLLTEHEMGELFKVLGLAKNCPDDFLNGALGFTQGDRSHRL